MSCTAGPACCGASAPATASIPRPAPSSSRIRFPPGSSRSTPRAAPRPTRHTRIRRWDQSGLVRRADGTTFHDLNASASSDGILIPAAGVQLSLENGILVDFALAAGGEFKVGDNWVFAARVADGSIEQLTDAPPRGIHHHYARLAVVTFPDSETDCRVLWPPRGQRRELRLHRLRPCRGT